MFKIFLLLYSIIMVFKIGKFGSKLRKSVVTGLKGLRKRGIKIARRSGQRILKQAKKVVEQKGKKALQDILSGQPEKLLDLPSELAKEGIKLAKDEAVNISEDILKEAVGGGKQALDLAERRAIEKGVPAGIAKAVRRRLEGAAKKKIEEKTGVKLERSSEPRSGANPGGEKKGNPPARVAVDPPKALGQPLRKPRTIAREGQQIARPAVIPRGGGKASASEIRRLLKARGRSAEEIESIMKRLK